MSPISLRKLATRCGIRGLERIRRFSCRYDHHYWQRECRHEFQEGGESPRAQRQQLSWRGAGRRLRPRKVVLNHCRLAEPRRLTLSEADEPRRLTTAEWRRHHPGLALLHAPLHHHIENSLRLALFEDDLAGTKLEHLVEERSDLLEHVSRKLVEPRDCFERPAEDLEALRTL
eukprot:scaffold49602_cov63-Phaeocystis_antarctica.AAC.9